MKTLVLVGSGEFTPAMDETDQYLLSLTSDPVVAILSDNSATISAGLKHFREFGTEVFGVPLFNPGDADNKDLVDQISKANFIYVTGSNADNLLRILKDSMVWKTVYTNYNKGAVVVGASAGALVMGKRVQNKESFGLVPVSLFPPLDNDTSYGSDPENSISLQPDNWMGIDRDTAVVLEDTVATIHGPGAAMLVINGRRSLYHDQDSFTF